MPVTNDGAHQLSAIEKDIPIVFIDNMVNEFRDKINAVLIDNESAL